MTNAQNTKLLEALVYLLASQAGLIDLSTADKAFITSTIYNHALK